MPSKRPRSSSTPSPVNPSGPIYGALDVDPTRDPQNLLNLLNQGCPPTVLGTIYPAPSSDYLHAIKLGTDNPAAFLKDTNVTFLPKWHLRQVVESSMAHEGTSLGSEAQDKLYWTEYHRRLQALEAVQSQVVIEYDRLGEQLTEWEAKDEKPCTPQPDHIMTYAERYELIYGPQRKIENRTAHLRAEIKRIKARRRESLDALGLAWLLDLNESGDIAVPEQHSRYYRGRKGLPVQRCSTVSFEPEDDLTVQTEKAAEAMIELSKPDDRSHTASSADSTPDTKDAQPESTRTRAMSEDITEVETIIVTSCCKLKRSLDTRGLITTDDEEPPKKRQRKSLSVETHLEEEDSPSATRPDASGGVYSNNDGDSDITNPTVPVNAGRPRSLSPLFHTRKTLSESTIRTLESDFPFLASIHPSTLRYDYYHFLSYFGNSLTSSAPSTSTSNSAPTPIPITFDSSPRLVPSQTPTQTPTPTQQPRKSLKTEINAWFARNGEDGLVRADAFLKCLWEACGELVPIEETDKTEGERRYRWKE